MITMTNSQTNVTLKGEHNIMHSPNLTYKGGFLLSCSAIPGNQISPSKCQEISPKQKEVFKCKSL